VAGTTNFPIAAGLQLTCVGCYSDAFVSKLNPSGSALVYSTYLGGSGVGASYGITVDASGNAYVTGYTGSTNFPTANALQSTPAGGYPAFVTKINARGSALVYSTYLGGSDGLNALGADIAVDGSGNAYVTGNTTSANFPTVNALQSTWVGMYAVFVSKLNPSGSALVYSTYLGGSFIGD